MFRFNDFIEDLGIKQSILQELLDYSQSNISKLANGKGELPENKIDILIKHFGEDVVSKYISKDEKTVDRISSYDSSTNYGHNNTINSGNQKENFSFMKIIITMQEQMNRLIALNEKSQEQVSVLIEQLKK